VSTSAFTRLHRILDLEEKQGWRNRAVIGGIQAMGERWAKDAHEEQADQACVEAIVALMAHYEAAPPAARPDIAEKMRRVLSGEGLELLEVVGETAAQAVEEEMHEYVDDAGMIYEVDFPPPEPTHVAQERIKRQQPRIERSPHDLQAAPALLAGVGPATMEQLERLGIHKIIDLLWHLPVRHEDFSRLRTISQLQPGEQVTIIANLWDIKERKIGVNRAMVQGILADGTGTLHATWWNKYVKNQLTIGATMRFSGKVGLYMGQKTLDNPVFEDIDDDMVSTGRLSPVYRLTEGLSNKKLRNLIRQALDEFMHFLADPLPREVRSEYNLPDFSNALQQMHFPDSPEQLAAARRRLAFEEFYYIQLGVLQRRRELQSRTAPTLVVGGEMMERFKAALPFAFTGAQERVLNEVLLDLARSTPMTRLVQGDVGSGKTAVAAGAMWVTVCNGFQAALIAPTQILAEQHHRVIHRLLGQLARPGPEGAPAPLQVELLTGRVSGSERARILDGLRDGTVGIVIGTTALIQEHVEVNNLGLVVVDEQHRFGVEQRGALRNRAQVAPEQQPHVLVMSATPIPRSLALTIYGDLDLSIVDETPPGRTPVMTKLFRPGERERLYAFLRREVRAGRQAYIVYPLVEESEKLEAGAAVEGYEQLRREILPELRIGLLHGRMSGAEKDEIMRTFASHELDVLVSTSVIEVGIDVPNASLILIEDAERFGLAQLHQLRGRVGRGAHQSYCALISKAEGSEAEERLNVLASTENGFVLAEKDLELRGPGDFLGTRQSGLPDLRVAFLGDLPTLSLARTAAQQLFAEDPELRRYPQLEKQVRRFWRGHGDIS
jgi:ATP-dependent DNA helicase RecG